jgi:heme exporter protein A
MTFSPVVSASASRKARPAPDEPFLCVKGLEIVRGARAIVDHLTFSVMPGQTLLIKGPNGSGKSSLLRVLAGLLATEKGGITLAEQALQPEQVHYVAEATGLKEVWSVMDNLAFWQHCYQPSKSGEVTPKEALAFWQMEHLADLPVRFLSQGQKKRVALARCLLNHRCIWLLDEPTNALDEASFHLLEAMMQRHLALDGMVLIATHDDRLKGDNSLTLALPSCGDRS